MINKAEEMFVVVDQNDELQPPLPRKLVHGHGVWHRVSHIWLTDGADNILCQQRTLDKEVNPGYWEPFFGGHLRPGETYEQGAERELKEELGELVGRSALKHLLTYKFDDPTGYNREFMAVYSAIWQGDPEQLQIDPEEVAKVIWLPKEVIGLGVAGETDQKWTSCGYEAQVLEQL